MNKSELMSRLLKSEDVKRFFVVSTLLFWCACMVAVRIDRTGSFYYRFLLGNLFLACVPLFLSTVLRVINRLRLHWTMMAGVSCLWLLFLPNAPYILTDILHLTRTSDAPAWYDLALLLSCSGTGLLLGYLSLIDVQRIVARRFNPLLGWLFAIVSLGLSGFAIYLGRFLRWNSWDVLVTPTRLLEIAGAVMHPVANVHALSVTLIFGVILTLGYITLRVLLPHESSSNSTQSD
ncbi:MAG TPA: DUF1361 domain-containing protein [Pyrinomonadaceae bacterium]|jgi:uncharacterized membrane protein|nr:DUF1361 domain-containing protein [Pyrinomonadaceae bacterium]